ncbi:hypothetical protein M231_05482 [Tremella mesenterica]|uniref:Uncharacterized protein n=1 Tax=Tremella mesenterica TaxID=5217 RepID=A0A4Q1BHZ9_TREME|nr:hypothetical protein M231_05482 [Tremella mesenterica]
MLPTPTEEEGEGAPSYTSSLPTEVSQQIKHVHEEWTRCVVRMLFKPESPPGKALGDWLLGVTEAPFSGFWHTAHNSSGREFETRENRQIIPSQENEQYPRQVVHHTNVVELVLKALVTLEDAVQESEPATITGFRSNSTSGSRALTPPSVPYVGTTPGVKGSSSA